MLKRPLQLTTMITLCVMIALSPLVFAGTTYTWDYTKFNTSTPDYRDLETAQTSISVMYYNHLTFNDTTGTSKAVMGICNGSSGTIYHIDSIWVKDGTFEVVINLPSYVKIASGTWTENGTMYFSISKSGDIVVYEKAYDGTKTIIIDDYNVGTFTTRALSGSGDTDYTESGYLSAELGGAIASGIDIEAWLPTIISLAMLSIVIGFLKKMG